MATGGIVNLSRVVSRFNRVSVQYRYQRFSATNGEMTLDELGIQPTLSAAGVSFQRDTRDNLFDPTKGWFNELRLESAGGALGGASLFNKVTTDSRYFRGFAGGAVFAAQLRLGASSQRGGLSDISSTERFRLGGSTTVRGFPERSLGEPDAFGNFRGDLMMSNVDVRMPIKGIVGFALFVDAGNLWNAAADIPDNLPLFAAGGGLRIRTPIGPARLDVGLPLSRYRDESRKPRWWIALGNPF